MSINKCKRDLVELDLCGARLGQAGLAIPRRSPNMRRLETIKVSVPRGIMVDTNPGPC
jgi:hypothetical protein